VVQDSTQAEHIETRFLEDEMRESFIDYSMSVIVQRALPDARDGLKPVHRRILYAMHELGLGPSGDYKKSATVVGDVLGKYHPHGDSAVYDTIVRMVQEFSMRYPLIDGQGNFGSIDGDSAAAYRYTEVKLEKMSRELLRDIDRETVDFADNFDGRLQEPTVLPTRVPHLLLNGTDGIAVGMSTKIPPHNLTELLRATDHLVRHPDCEVADLMEHVKGPDFPTGGYVWGTDAIENAYETGRGLIEMRARMHVEEGNYGKSSIVVTELPYQVNKSKVIDQITRTVKRGQASEISDLRDESDRDGIRLVIELKRDAEPRDILDTLLKKTQLKYTFGVINLALRDGEPVQMDLKESLECFVDHRLEVIQRRARHELDECEDRAHVVEGLLRALDDIDRVIELIRGSRSPAEAREALQEEMEMTERQAEAILAMRLSRLTSLEHESLREELEDLEARIEELRHLVEEDEARRAYLRDDLEELIEEYGDPRRTQVLEKDGEFPLPSGTGGQANLVMITRRGYLKAQPARGGAGMAGAEALASREGDYVRQAFVCRGSDHLLVVTDRGRVHDLPIRDLPRGTRSSRGRAITDHVELEDGDEIAAVVPVESFSDEEFLLTCTREGQVKKTELAEYSNIRSGGIIGAGMGEDDRILAAFATGGGDQVLLASRDGQVIRFEESEVRAMGRSAQGVKGMDLEEGDEVVAALSPRADGEVLAATAFGFAKRVPVTEFRVQGRAGKGTMLLPDLEETGELVGLMQVSPGDRIMWERADGGTSGTEVVDVPSKARRGASHRTVDVPADEPPVVAVHPLRSTPEEAESEDGESGDGDAEAVSAETDREVPAAEETEAAAEDEDAEQGHLEL